MRQPHICNIYTNFVWGLFHLDDSVRLLNDHTDLAAKQMLQNVIERKRKFDATEKNLLVTRAITLILLGLFLFYIWFFIVKATNYSFSSSISIFFNHSLHLFILLLISSGFGANIYLDKKKEKAEKEYHDLRCEIIKKSIDLWPQPEKWDYRLDVFEMMKSKYDINLYHESK